MHAFADSIPAIEALESLRAYEVAVIASGGVKAEDAHRVLDRWRRDAGVRRAMRGASMEAVAAMHGIGVVIEESNDGDPGKGTP